MPFDGRAAQQHCATIDGRALALDRVINLLGDPVRWCKGTSIRPLFAFNPNDGRKYFVGNSYCVSGGLDTLQGRIDDRIQIRAAVRATIREVCGKRHRHGIPKWNDDPTTTHGDVMRVLLRSRARLAAGERFPPLQSVFVLEAAT